MLIRATVPVVPGQVVEVRCRCGRTTVPAPGEEGLSGARICIRCEAAASGCDCAVLTGTLT